MSEVALKLVSLIQYGYSLNEISHELGLSNKQIYNLLRDMKNRGMDFTRKYYYNGEIVYAPKKDTSFSKHSVGIVTCPSDSTFRAVFISDLHAGNKLENRGAWDSVYNYCIKKGINIIINAGDLIDGINIGYENSKIHSNPLEQIKYVVDSYPYDKNILNFVALGNHDIDSLINFGIDFATYLTNFRHDIVPVGYGYGKIYVKNDKILLLHPLHRGLDNEIDTSSSPLIINGHQHRSRCIINEIGNISLYVPTLSDMFLSSDNFLPSAFDITLTFGKDGYFETIYIEHLLINKDKASVINSVSYSINMNRNKKNNTKILNEENYNIRKLVKK